MSDSFWTSSVDARSGWLTLDDIEKALELYRARAMEPYVEVISLDEWRRRHAERFATCATWLRETAHQTPVRADCRNSIVTVLFSCAWEVLECAHGDRRRPWRLRHARARRACRS